MRHDQADVADGAAHGHSQPSQQRRGNVDDQANARHVHAKMHRLFFSGEEQVQIGSRGVNRTSGSEEPTGVNNAANTGESMRWGSTMSARMAPRPAPLETPRT